MAWNYRVVKKKLSEDAATYDVCEVYYDEEGKPNSWAWGQNVMSGDSMVDLEDTMEKVREALEKPILEIVGKDEGLREINEVADGLMTGLQQALAYAKGDKNKATSRTVILPNETEEKKQWYAVDGSLETDVDEDTFNDEFLNWVESKGWRFMGMINPFNED